MSASGWRREGVETVLPRRRGRDVERPVVDEGCAWSVAGQAGEGRKSLPVAGRSCRHLLSDRPAFWQWCGAAMRTGIRPHAWRDRAASPRLQAGLRIDAFARSPRADPVAHDASRWIVSQASTSRITRPATSVSRRSIPLWRKVNSVWSMPSRCRIVAWTSLQVVGFSTARKDHSSVLP